MSDHERMLTEYATARKRAEQDAYDAAMARKAKDRARKDCLVNPRRHQVIPEAAVIQIRPRATETHVCPCGSQWFSMHYRMDTSGRIIERSGVATCDGGCGRKHEVTK